jgi:hypothetical protein
MNAVERPLPENKSAMDAFLGFWTQKHLVWDFSPKIRFLRFLRKPG